MDEDLSTLAVEADLAWRETGGEIVVLDLRGSVYFGLNPTAARLWTLLARGATRDELVLRLVDDQRIDAARAGADVDEFLGVLRREKLLTSVPAA